MQLQRLFTRNPFQSTFIREQYSPCQRLDQIDKQTVRQTDRQTDLCDLFYAPFRRYVHSIHFWNQNKSRKRCLISLEGNTAQQYKTIIQQTKQTAHKLLNFSIIAFFVCQHHPLLHWVSFIWHTVAHSFNARASFDSRPPRLTVELRR